MHLINLNLNKQHEQKKYIPLTLQLEINACILLLLVVLLLKNLDKRLTRSVYWKSKSCIIKLISTCVLSINKIVVHRIAEEKKSTGRRQKKRERNRKQRYRSYSPRREKNGNRGVLLRLYHFWSVLLNALISSDWFERPASLSMN